MGGQKASNLRNMGLVLLLVKWAINWKGGRGGDFKPEETTDKMSRPYVRGVKRRVERGAKGGRRRGILRFGERGAELNLVNGRVGPWVSKGTRKAKGQ